MTYASLYCKAFKSPPSGVGEPEQCSVSIYCGFSVGCCRQRCPLRSNCRHKHEQGNCRARALGPRLPREKWAHLRDHAKERRISQVDLFALAAEDPDVPDGDWFKDFGTFKLCGTGRLPSAFLLAGQAAHGKPL